MIQNKKLSAFQLFSLCAMASMLGLSAAGRSGLTPAYFWITIIIFALQSAAAALLSHTFRQCGSDSFGDMLSRLVSAPVARLLLAAFGLLLAVRASAALAVQTGAVKLYLLEDTSGFAIMLILLLTAFAALLPGIRRMSGTAVLFTLMLPFLLAIIIVTGLLGAEWGELRTVFQPDIRQAAPAFVPAVLTASGTECVLFLLGSGRTGKGAGRAAVIAPAVCALIFAAMFCVSVGTIGLGGTASTSFPFIEASRQISSGGIELTERFDLPLITASLFASIVQLAVYTLSAAMALSEALSPGNTGRVALGLLPAEFAIAMFVRYSTRGYIVGEVCAWGIAAWIAIILPLLALISIIRFRRGDEGE